jgi:hypothetical protein
MLKRIISQFLKSSLTEIFENGDTALQSGDLFAYFSSTTAQNLTFRRDLFDTWLYPVRLLSGSVGRLRVDGLAEAALGGALKIRVDNVFLLFAVDGAGDPEYAHILKKLRLEMQPKKISDAIIRSLVHRLFGIPEVGEGREARQQKKMFLIAVKFLLRNVQLTIKNIHIRIETSPGARSKGCSAIGVSLPSITIGPQKLPEPVRRGPSGGENDSSAEGHTKTAAAATLARGDGSVTLLMSMKSLQLYADYECDSYVMKGYSAEDIHHLFAAKWKSEVHAGILLPFDVDLAVLMRFDEQSASVLPSVSVQIPQFHAACDPKQLEVGHIYIYIHT